MTCEPPPPGPPDAPGALAPMVGTDGNGLPLLPVSFSTTRHALHLVAARILGAARHAAVGRMGLMVVPGGFATADFGGRQLAVVDGALVDGTERHELTTLSAAAAFVGVDLAAVPHPALALEADPDAPLAVDPAAARLLGQWFALCQTLLDEVLSITGPDDVPSAVQLWPEHFDLALEVGPAGARANYGGSPGDDGIDEPYLYVGPHDDARPVDAAGDEFWNVAFGAALTYRDLRGGASASGFFRHGRTLLGSR